jgi:hypothetical protein
MSENAIQLRFGLRFLKIGAREVGVWDNVSTEIIVHSFLCCGISVDVSGRENNIISVFRTDDCSDWLRLLADRYANRISDAQFESDHHIDSDVESDIELINFISSNA